MSPGHARTSARTAVERCGFREAHGRAAGEAFLKPLGPEMGWEESLGLAQAVMVVGVQPGTEEENRFMNYLHTRSSRIGKWCS